MYTWQFASTKSRPAQWYVVALIVVLFLVIYGIFEGMYLMSVVAFLFAGVYILMENNATPVTTVSIDEHAIVVGGTSYDFSNIEKFTLLKNENDYVLLRFFLKKSLSQVIDIPLTEAVDAYGLREFLAARITLDSEADWNRSDRLIHAMKL